MLRALVLRQALQETEVRPRAGIERCVGCLNRRLWGAEEAGRGITIKTRPMRRSNGGNLAKSNFYRAEQLVSKNFGMGQYIATKYLFRMQLRQKPM